jgi:drug/metabolite transporter (DMT)-like permease
MQMCKSPALWVVVLASGTTNAAFNWAMVAGDVVRVILLFYLMPLWSVLLARWLLKENITQWAVVRLMLGLAGAAVVLWPAGSGLQHWPVPRSLADWLGVLGGLAFALNNVMLRRERHCSEMSRALAMFVGGAGVAGVVATVLPAVPWPSAHVSTWLPLVLMMAVLLGLSNLALQFGAARLPASVTAVVMLTEVVFASLSALAWGGAVLTTSLFVGGALILLAALLSALMPSPPAPESATN